jgi:hypothetical protein
MPPEPDCQCAHQGGSGARLKLFGSWSVAMAARHQPVDVDEQWHARYAAANDSNASSASSVAAFEQRRRPQSHQMIAPSADLFGKCL